MRRKHSPEGEKYRTLGEGAYTAQHREKLRRRRRIKKLGRRETSSEKDRGTYLGPNQSASKSSGSAFEQWRKKHGYGTSPNVLRKWREHQKNKGK